LKTGIKNDSHPFFKNLRKPLDSISNLRTFRIQNGYHLIKMGSEKDLEATVKNGPFSPGQKELIAPHPLRFTRPE
jgi:hypothetical protein